MGAKRQIGVRVVAVVMTISEGALKTLLVRADEEKWSLPMGTPRAAEPLLTAANRIIAEQADIEVEYLEQLYTFDPLPDAEGQRVVEVTYYGLVPSVLLRSPKLAQRDVVNWFAENGQPPLTRDHAEVISVARDRLRGKMAYTAVGFELLPEKFTLAELQNLYEVILGKELDKRNFRKKINDLGILEATGEERAPRRGRGRPASLYRFRREVFHSIDTKGNIFPF
jgi:8-oxo-dGTP diphosphatase